MTSGGAAAHMASLATLLAMSNMVGVFLRRRERRVSERGQQSPELGGGLHETGGLIRLCGAALRAYRGQARPASNRGCICRTQILEAERVLRAEALPTRALAVEPGGLCADRGSGEAEKRAGGGRAWWRNSPFERSCSGTLCCVACKVSRE